MLVARMTSLDNQIYLFYAWTTERAHAMKPVQDERHEQNRNDKFPLIFFHSHSIEVCSLHMQKIWN